jgi:hypothetical protein
MPTRILESKKQAFESDRGLDKVFVEKFNDTGNPGTRDDFDGSAGFV